MCANFSSLRAVRTARPYLVGLIPFAFLAPSVSHAGYSVNRDQPLECFPSLNRQIKSLATRRRSRDGRTARRLDQESGFPQKSFLIVASRIQTRLTSGKSTLFPQQVGFRPTHRTHRSQRAKDLDLARSHHLAMAIAHSSQPDNRVGICKIFAAVRWSTWLSITTRSLFSTLCRQ